MSIGRILALDMGDKRIGVATSDLTQTIAGGSHVYERRGEGNDIKYFTEFISSEEVVLLVIGLPKNMDGSEGEQAQKARAFGDKLRAKLPPDIGVEYMDERMTTMSAERVLLEADMRRDKRKTVIDKVAAAVILQAYLDKRRFIQNEQR
jgi:putative Holliday junction resolvase